MSGKPLPTTIRAADLVRRGSSASTRDVGAGTGDTAVGGGADDNRVFRLARKNAADAGVTNVEFLRGRIAEIPLPSNSVDVIISNCVVNLSGDEQRVIDEAFRVLKPGGRFAVSDVVVQGELPGDVKLSMELWVGCVAGAVSDAKFLKLLSDAGFENPTVEFTRTYELEEAKVFLMNTGGRRGSDWRGLRRGNQARGRGSEGQVDSQLRLCR